MQMDNLLAAQDELVRREKLALLGQVADTGELPAYEIVF
jgi:hypothetical protein